MRKVLLALSVTFILFRSYAEKIEDFEVKPGLKVYKGDERGGAFELAEAPEPRGFSGKASWKDRHYKYNEYSFKKPVLIPEKKDELRGVLSVCVYSPGGRKVNYIGLRLRDAKGEMFQWRKKVSLEKKGWRKLVFDLKPDNYDISWGKTSDKKIDMPVLLYGFSIDYNPKSFGKGEIYFDDIEYVPASDKKIDCSKVLYRFDRSEKWWTWNRKDKKFSIIPEKNCIALSRKPHPQRSYYSLVCMKMNLKPVGDLSEIEVKAEYSGENNSSLAVDLSDSKNKALRLPFKILKQGDNKIVWSIPPDVSKKKGAFKPPYNIKDVVVSFSPSEKESTLKLFSLKSVSKREPMECIDIDVVTGNPIHVLKKGEEKNLALKISNSSDRTLNFKLDMSLEDFFSENAVISKNFVIPAASSVLWKVPFIPRKMGIWWLNFTLREIGEKEASYMRRSFAYMRPAGPTKTKPSGFLFSICTHTERWSRRDHELEVLASAMCGAKVIRTGVTWGGLEREKGVWDWTTMDRLVDLYGKNGMELQYILAFTPRWAAPESAQKSSDWLEWSRAVPEESAWRNYVSTFAKRYDGKIRFLEVWNEPDLYGFFRGNPDDYMKMLKAAYEEIKKVDPDLKVMTGGFATLRYHPGKKYPDMHARVVEEAQDYFDIHAFHQHGSFDIFQHEVNGLLTEIRKKLKTPKPLYFNETAVCSIDDSQKMQAETLFKKLLFAFARGAMGYTWYDLRNDGYDPKNGEHNYGLLSNDFYPKAAYPVYNNLALNFSDKKFITQFNIGVNRYAFLFGGPNEQIVACWNEEGGDADEHIVIETDAEKVYSMDIMGNKKLLPLTKKMTILELSSIPSCTILEGAKSKPEIVGNLIKIIDKENIIPGRKGKIEFELLNPFDDKKEYEISWLVPEGLKLDGAQKLVSIPPQKKANIKLNFLLPADKAPIGNGKFFLKLFYKIKNSDWRGNLVAPLKVARLASSRSFDERAPDFVIEKRKNVFNFAENNPATAHLTWQGAKDLSARIWLAQGDGSIKIRIAVRDDVFCQRWNSGEVWKGDNVQMGLQVPGQQGFWELGFTRLDNGTSEVFNWMRPVGFEDPSREIALKTEKLDDGLLYEIEIPVKALGITESALKKGVKFNLIVNDNDGEGREGWIEIAPGIGQSKNPELFPVIVFE